MFIENITILNIILINLPPIIHYLNQYYSTSFFLLIFFYYHASSLHFLSLQSSITGISMIPTHCKPITINFWPMVSL